MSAKINKTILATAVAAAMAIPAVASADLTLSGRLQVQVVSYDADDALQADGWADGTFATDGGIANDVLGGNWSAIDLKGSRDLGNGLTGLMHLSNNILPAGDGINFGTREMLIGVKGDFGTVTIGRMGTAFNTAGRDPLNATFMQSRGNGARLGGAGGLGNGSYVNSAVGYANSFGGVGVAANLMIDDGASDHAFAVRVTVPAGPVSIYAAHINAPEGYQDLAQTTGNDFVVSKVGVAWSDGPFGVVAEYEMTDEDVRDGDGIFVSGSYTMGATRFVANYGTIDDLDQTYMAVGALHSLGQGVSLLAGYRSTEVAAGTQTSFGAGMRVSF